MPPLNPPSDAQGTPSMPTLDLTDCQDNDQGTGLLTPVSTFVSQIKALKADPDHQIIVSSISAPPTPYAVAWFPAVGRTEHPARRAVARDRALLRRGGRRRRQPRSDDVPDRRQLRRSRRAARRVRERLLEQRARVDLRRELRLGRAGDRHEGRPAAQQRDLPHRRDSDRPSTDCRTARPSPRCRTPAAPARACRTPSCEANGNTAPCWTLVDGRDELRGADGCRDRGSGAPSSSVTVSCQICNPGANPGASVPGCSRRGPCRANIYWSSTTARRCRRSSSGRSPRRDTGCSRRRTESRPWP